jgi:hypothetical protein
MLTMARHPIANSGDVRTAVHLLRLLPPTNIFASLKSSQYLSRLSHSWHRKPDAAPIVLFDQAFVQAVCSLALRAGVTNDTAIANALNYVPRSDLLIRLEAPLELLKARLHDRWLLQSMVEQLFELDLKKSIASIQMMDRLHNLLLQQGRSVLSAASLDQRSLADSMDVIEKEVIAKLQHGGQKSSMMTAKSAVPCHGEERNG